MVAEFGVDRADNDVCDRILLCLLVPVDRFGPSGDAAPQRPFQLKNVLEVKFLGSPAVLSVK